MPLTNEIQDRARRHILECAETANRTADQCLDSVLEAAQLIIDTFESGGKLLLCGNGGSAADCQHMATEFVSRLSKEIERPGLPAVALTTDTSFLTAYPNDFDFAGIFERQVQALGKPGDVLIAISTSGNSSNVMQAVDAARRLKMKSIGLTGDTGMLGEAVDIGIRIPSGDTQHIQEAHLAVEHVLCELVERSIYESSQIRSAE